MGVAPEDQQRIFERFGRAEAGRTVDGSGLGLAIVTAIAHGHGGTVGLRSSPGHGAEFTLCLPESPPAAAPVPATGLGGSSNVVDVNVRYLRNKLGAERIVTVRGAGYRLAELGLAGSAVLPAAAPRHRTIGRRRGGAAPGRAGGVVLSRRGPARPS